MVGCSTRRVPRYTFTDSPHDRKQITGFSDGNYFGGGGEGGSAAVEADASAGAAAASSRRFFPSLPPLG